MIIQRAYNEGQPSAGLVKGPAAEEGNEHAADLARARSILRHHSWSASHSSHCCEMGSQTTPMGGRPTIPCLSRNGLARGSVHEEYVSVGCVPVGVRLHGAPVWSVAFTATPLARRMLAGGDIQSGPVVVGPVLHRLGRCSPLNLVT